jgi:signal transduction histidine kinase
MAEGPLPGGYRRSIFVKLLTIITVMAGSLLALVIGFFTFYIGPHLEDAMVPVEAESARLVAAGAPDLEAARRLGARLDVRIRYEGPHGVWQTAPMRTIAEVRGRDPHQLMGPDYYVVAAPDGGRYLFAWTFRRRMHAAHQQVLGLLVFLMLAVFLVTHAVLRRLLRPVRELSDGVARLAEGELDVTVANRSRDELGALTDAFNRMVGRVRAMIRARDQLLLDVSHELRSPLTRLKVALEMAPAGKAREGMAADLAEMEVMIGELLELERLREGGIRPAPTDLVALVDAVASAYRDRPPGVRVVATPPEIVLDLDAEKMRTVVRNLVENGVKYSLPDSRPVEVTATRSGDAVIVRVSDDGPGIPATDQASIFEPFYRVDRSRSRKTGGYGLGLSIAKRVVEAHGGTLTVQDNAGRGTTFVVTLPAGAGRTPAGPR